MAVEYGMSLIAELKEVLERRRNVLEIFGTYKSTYDSFIQELKSSFKGADEDTAASAIYLASYVMDTVKDRKKRLTPMDESERIRIVLENLLVARQYYPVDLPSLIHIYQLIFDWAIKIEKEMVKQARLHTNTNVVIVNLVDIFAVPLFKFMKNVNKDMDLRWAMAELQGAMTKEVSPEVFEEIKIEFPLSEMKTENFFIAGEFVIRPFVENYMKTKGDRSELEVFGDIGEKPYEIATSSFYDLEKLELYMNSSFTSKFANKEDKELKSSLNEVIKLNHDLLRKSEYKFIFANFYVKIESKGQIFDRRLFLHNLEGKKLGAYTYLLIPAENINLKVLDSYVKTRFTDIKGLKEFDTYTDVEKDVRLEYWNETYINTLQEEYDFLSENDTKREQAFLPFAILKQEKDDKQLEIILSSSEESKKRVRVIDGIQKENIQALDKVKEISNYIRPIILTTLNVLRHLLINYHEDEIDVKIEFYPEEMLFESEKEEEKIILVRTITDNTRLVSIIAENKSIVGSKGLMKQRQMNSKINQLLTELRVKSLEDAVKNRLEDTGLFNVYKKENFESGKLYFKGKVSQSLDSFDATAAIEEELKKAKLMEEERLERLRKEEEEKLTELRRIYYEEIIPDKLSVRINKFLEKIVFTYFDKNLGNEKIKRKLNGVLDEIDEWEESKEKFIDDGISKILKEMLENLEPIITVDIKDSIENTFVKIKERISKMTTDELLEKI